jgi:hypothetical protein
MAAGDAADARADRELRLVGRVPDRHHVLVDVLRVLDDDFLAGRVFLRDLDRRQRLPERLRDPAHAVGIVLPAEHLVDDVHVAEKIRDDAVMGLALDVLEENGARAVEMLLEARHLEIGIDFLRRLDEVALGLEPGERRAQVAHLGGLGLGLGVGLLDHHVHGRLLRDILIGGGTGRAAAPRPISPVPFR